MPPQNSLDFRPGTVLHIKDYSSRGHPPRNKYVVVIGLATDNVALGFLISSQLGYLERDTHRSEVVRIPHNATTFIRVESIIQCFEMERLLVDSLCEGFENGRVTCPGRLKTKYLHRIREVVQASNLLPQEDIEIALRLLPTSGP
jgi:hypothetical protein